ncbi:MAG TPA: iron ABC transporter permease [Pelagibacterium sp.]|uniref:FecCD family ABC transporter permease n=1 Tax=Pelagibacterium sp. TaxID=1967288 RepID=UPI002BC291CB|nr:iron ABC transporter permease [Pelagibacterium sp.]HWJ87700.1 iron ABC transporter permease [Pelagibacterium sp.]
MALRYCILVALLAATAVVSLNMGSFAIGPGDVLATLFGQGTAKQELTLYTIRLPRLVMAMLVGAGLALSGALLQGVSRNALADPGILGLNAGAGLSILALLYLRQQGIVTLPGALWPPVAFVGALATAIAIYLLARKQGRVEPGRLLLAGIAINAGASAAMLVLSMRLDRRLYDAASVWLAGSLSGARWADVFAILPWLVVLAPLLAGLVRVLDILGVGDDTATGLGVGVESGRLALLAVAVAFAGTAVALAGAIGFVGLLGPHIARRLVGPRHHLLLPAAALVGAGLMLLADTVGRNLLAPIEIPAGVVVAVLGAPYFLYLLIRTNRQAFTA